MKLERLRVRRFKSLYDVDLTLEDFSVLTGPNGSGKTNLVDSIAFLGEVYSYGVEYAVGRAGGIDAIAFRDKRRTTIGVEFGVKATLSASEVRFLPRSREEASEASRALRVSDSGQDFSIEHTFILKGAADSISDYAVTTETVRLALRIGSEEVTLLTAESATDDGPPSIDAPALPSDLPERESQLAGRLLRNFERVTADPFGVAPGASILEWLALLPGVREFQRRMSFIRAYRFNPSGCRQPGVLTPNAALESNGGNLPAVVARMKKRETRAWANVLANMRILLPTLTSIDAEPSAEYGLVLTFQEEGRGRPWSAHEVSDGTIQALAMLAALSDSRPPIVVIEEPENTVHPWVLRRFVEQARNLTNKQVVLTTHSPVLLKLVKPEEVYLLWRHRGRTKVKNLVKLAPDSRRLYYEEGFDVFELYDSGLVTEVVPGLNVTG